MNETFNKANHFETLVIGRVPKHVVLETNNDGAVVLTGAEGTAYPGPLDVTVSSSRPASGDRTIQVNITQSTGVALSGTLDGIYARATAGDATGAGTVRGCEIGGRVADVAGNVCAVVTGGYFWADVKAREATILRGVEVSLDGGAGGTSTTAQGIVVFNNSSATQTTSIGVDINGGTPTGHKAFTYDFRGQNGETLSNSTNLVWDFGTAQVKANSDSLIINQRHRVTVAEMNAGHTLVSAVAGLKPRLIDVKVIAVGGNTEATANATGIGVYGVQGTVSTVLYTALLAALTQGAVCQLNTANTSVPTDGASFLQNDANSAITCRAISAGNYDLITVQNFDVILTYALEV